MIRVGLAALLICNAAVSAPLDDAIALVVEVAPLVAERRIDLAVVEKTKPFDMQARVGYQQKGTQTDAAGINAGVYVTIPLFSTKREREAAKARALVAQAQDQVLTSFLGDVAALEQADQEQMNAQLAADFNSDRMDFGTEQEEQGLIDGPELWPMADALRQANASKAMAERKRRAAIERVARRFGAYRWEELRTLLENHLKATRV